MTDEATDRSRRVRRNSRVLGAVALAIYVAFIARTVLGLRGP